MFKVLIADDEMFVRIGIKNSIDWLKYGMEVIDDVADGHQAWESYNKNKPDIILTDLKMPQMDGMELISRVRSKDKKTKIIILSCIEEFKLIQMAMTYGVSGYILKLTMTWDEMDGVLTKVTEELKQQHVMEQDTLTEKQHSGLLKTQIFSEIIFKQDVSKDHIEEIVNRKKLRLTPKNLLLCLMEIDKYSTAEETGQLPSNGSIISLIDEILGGYKRGEVIYFEEKRYAILYSFNDLNDKKEINEDLYKILVHIKRLMEKYYNLSVTFSISTLQDGYLSVGNQYQECNQALLKKFYTGKGAYLYFSNEKEDIPNLYVRPLLKKIVESCIAIFGEDYRKEFKDGISEQRLQALQTISDIRNEFVVWLQLPLTILKIVRQDVFLLQVSYADNIKESETLDEIYEVYGKYLAAITELIGKRTTYSREMLLVLQYIKENYRNDISLKQVANHVNLSPNYLSTVFKDEMNVNFVDYLSNFRVEKAKKALLNTNCKLYEISEQVGFSDVGYFCRIFKKITGYRPNEFKSKFLPQEF